MALAWPAPVFAQTDPSASSSSGAQSDPVGAIGAASSSLGDAVADASASATAIADGGIDAVGVVGKVRGLHATRVARGLVADAGAVVVTGGAAPYAFARQAPNPMQPEGAPLDEPRQPPPGLGPLREPTDAGDVLIWVPRALFFPVYLITEYGLRKPLAFVVGEAEKRHIPQKLVGFFTWDGLNGGVFPLLDIRTDFDDSWGAGLFWNNLITEGTGFQLGARANPGQNLYARASAEYETADENFTFGTRLWYQERDDYLFYGVGTQFGERDFARFYKDTLGARAEAEFGPFDGDLGGWFHLTFLDENYGCTEESADICGDDDRADTADDRIPLEGEGVLSSFSEGYEILEASTRWYVDSRAPYPGPGDGLRLELIGGLGTGLGEHPETLRYGRYGAELSGFVDLAGLWQRTLAVRLLAEFVDPIGDEAVVPFERLIGFGGLETMHAFQDGRFLGRSGIIGEVAYRWPIWSFLEGNLFFETGNVFGPHLEGFEFDDLRASFGLGVRSVLLHSRHISYVLNLAFGTSAFERGFDVETFRFNFGTNWGF